MRTFGDLKIIGVDAGYGNIKTANFYFRTGFGEFDAEPVFTRNMLLYNGKYYLIGEGHRRFTTEKTLDQDYYILTLAAIAVELEREGLTEANVFIAAGLPLSWVTRQKERYRAYLTKNQEVRFVFQNVAYTVHIAGAEVFPQGYAAIAERAAELRGTTLLCDIGNGTMNLLYLRDGRPDPKRMYTEKFGTQQCVNAIQDAVMNRFQTNMDEGIIEEYLITGEADVAKPYLAIMKNAAVDYVNAIVCRLAEHDYSPDFMRLYVVGGGGCLLRNFGKLDESRVTIHGDLCAAAKGYEYLAERMIRKGAEKK